MRAYLLPPSVLLLAAVFCLGQNTPVDAGSLRGKRICNPLSLTASNPHLVWQNSTGCIAAGVIASITTGTAAPSASACDASAELGAIYIQTGNPASVRKQVWACVQEGASSYGWQPVYGNIQATAPVTCDVGDLWFDSNATVGQNLYGCTSPNTWTLMAGAGATSISGISDLKLTKTSSTVLTLGAGTTFCGFTPYAVTSVALTISAGSAPTYLIYDCLAAGTANAIVAVVSTNTVTGSGFIQSATTNPTVGGYTNYNLLGYSTASSGTWDAVTDPRTWAGQGGIVANTGLTCDTDTNGLFRCGVNNTVATFGSIQSGAPVRCLDDGTGSDDTYTCAPAQAYAGYTDGMVVQLEALTANTGAATVNITSLGAKSIKLCDGSTDPANSDIAAGRQIPITYDGSVFRLPCNPATVSGASVTAGSQISVSGSTVSFNPTDASRMLLIEEFFNGSAASSLIGTYGWTSSGGTAAAATEAGHPGIVTMTANGANNTSDLYLPNDPFPPMNATTFDFKWIVKTPSTSTEIIYGFGLGDDRNPIANNNTINFFFGNSTGCTTNKTDTNWNYRTASGGSETVGTTNMPAVSTSTWYTLRMRSAVAGTILFSACSGNGCTLGTETSIATNVPSVALRPFARVVACQSSDKIFPIDGVFGYIDVAR